MKTTFSLSDLNFIKWNKSLLINYFNCVTILSLERNSWKCQVVTALQRQHRFQLIRAMRNPKWTMSHNISKYINWFNRAPLHFYFSSFFCVLSPPLRSCSLNRILDYLKLDELVTLCADFISRFFFLIITNMMHMPIKFFS